MRLLAFLLLGLGSAALAQDDKDILTIKIKCFLGCKESQKAVREALGTVKGLYDFSFDAKSNLATCKVVRKNLQTLDLEFALLRAGLGGEVTFSDPALNKTRFVVVGSELLDENDAPEKVSEWTFRKVFAGSPESEAAIREALKPHKITFIGKGPLKDVKLEGKEINPFKEQGRLKAAGFRTSGLPQLKD